MTGIHKDKDGKYEPSIWQQCWHLPHFVLPSSDQKDLGLFTARCSQSRLRVAQVMVVEPAIMRFRHARKRQRKGSRLRIRNKLKGTLENLHEIKEMPGAAPVVTTRNVTRHGQISPGRQNHPLQLRTEGLKGTVLAQSLKEALVPNLTLHDMNVFNMGIQAAIWNQRLQENLRGTQPVRPTPGSAGSPEKCTKTNLDSLPNLFPLGFSSGMWNQGSGKDTQGSGEAALLGMGSVGGRGI
nr:uncharacterized protein LOC105475204 [Macaca nemestrina]